MKKSQKLWAMTLVLIGAVSYGLLSPVFKLAIADGLGVAHLTFLQVFSGTVLLWLVLLIDKLGKRTVSFAGLKHSWYKFAIIGVSGLALTTVFINEALGRLDASLVIVLLFQYTWITIMLESIWKKQWPNRAEWIAIGCVMMGTVFAVGLIGQGTSDINGIGIMYGLLAAIVYSLFFFLSGIVKAEVNPLAKSIVMSTASVFLVILIYSPAQYDWSNGFSNVWWGLLLGILGLALPFFCFNIGIPKLGGGLAALLGAMELPAAVVASFFLLGEPITLWQVAGIALIIIGIMVAQRNANGSDAAGKEGE
ncbi:MAG: DMT family transporter [Candidatus Cohnella colombiensis]|uniref:DMT family transporter n=1 Tax=Candidatus Cohnella colombiensis TaxID=3121368 RepID=A0AA95JB87_9BACL|nr:MAG: DMT family transporter [Cohnella sp.]